MWTAISCCICFVLGLACDDKPQVTCNISEQRNTQLAVLCTGRAQFHEYKRWATNGSKEEILKKNLIKPYSLFVYRLSWMWTQLLIFFFFCDNQFTSVGFQSTIVLCTQEHSNTPCRGLKKTEKKPKKIPNTINAFTSTLPILNRQ